MTTGAQAMRKLMVLLVLLCGAASANAAEPEKWCSDGFNAPTVLSWSADGETMFVGSERWKIGGTHGAGVGVSLGTDYSNESGEYRLRYTTVTVEADENPGWREVGILIFRDRVFWPCDKSK